jgi:hypothetical protein
LGIIETPPDAYFFKGFVERNVDIFLLTKERAKTAIVVMAQAAAQLFTTAKMETGPTTNI